jgi:hypothetical protein
MGFAVIVHVILGPAFFLASFVQASRAMRWAEEKGVNHRYRDDGNMLRIHSAVLLVFSTVAFLGAIV